MVGVWRRCDLQVIIKRNSISFLVKALFVTILTVFVSMVTAANLHPEDQMGDRFAVLFIAFLVLAVNFSLDVTQNTTSPPIMPCSLTAFDRVTCVFAAWAWDRLAAHVG